ncbi:hypothetical protein HPB50_007588 [Hyalomma asiaticum]|uniref:Uncharacterized protein n=1 Tax=Hyalomma asiaticum TaxID=266040 RepID=A0ACB7TCI0_HYAAI|nr:hypothetical protein HPB50_007588 [Hyalomma asiaticum]
MSQVDKRAAVRPNCQPAGSHGAGGDSSGNRRRPVVVPAGCYTAPWRFVRSLGGERMSPKPQHAVLPTAARMPREPSQRQRQLTRATKADGVRAVTTAAGR